MADASGRGTALFALIAAASGFVGSTGGCGIDLTNSLEGRPCAEGRRCLSGYECSAENICVREGSGEHDASMEASTLGDSAGTGGATNDASDVTPAPDVMNIPDVVQVSPDAPANDATTAPETGPDAPTPPDGGNPFGGVVCRDLVCSGDEACCVANFPGYPNFPSPDDFSCESDPDACAYVLHCDGDHDCPSAQVCCAAQESSGSGNPWVATCRDSCDSGEVHVACTRTEHCEEGLVCCGIWQIFQSRFGETRCQSGSCSVPNRVFCTDNTVCDGSTPDCAEAASLPGFTFCQ
jgi:hypothetical protein